MSVWRERGHDLVQWPRNLVRDFPRRLGRLAVVRSPGPLPLRWWFARLQFALFDLIGGPELAQFFWHWLMQTSPLTAAEREAVVSVLGPRAIRYDDVRIAQGGVLQWVFKMNRRRAFCLWHTIHLPRGGRHARGQLDLLVHEATHVFQYERVGSIYIGEALLAQRRWGRAAYDYGGPAGLHAAWQQRRPLRSFNREQQAQIAQHFYACREQGDDLAAFWPYLTALRRGEF